eukprot:GHVT01078696.1.p1 GENE.GHVT01078696.1~~GHVT01078696.1.p1  ORF type:complete len:170 (+),score=26.82 GHVT01078696.1:393-902(+)
MAFVNFHSAVFLEDADVLRAMQDEDDDEPVASTSPILSAIIDTPNFPPAVGDNVQVPEWSFDESLLPGGDMNLMLYDGSLTTPPCSSTVRWVINTKPLPASRAQLSAMRKALLYDSDKNEGGAQGNFRETQPKGGRPIHRAHGTVRWLHLASISASSRRPKAQLQVRAK